MIRTICAWCGALIKETKDEGVADTLTSHGCCPGCREKAIKEYGL